MRFLVLLAVLLLAACGEPVSPATAPARAPSPAPVVAPATTPTPAEDREALLARIDQFNSTIREGDKDGYADVFVDDFVFTWSRNGQIYDRESILPNVVPTPDYNPLVDEHIVRIYGDSAIVNYRVRKEEGEDGARVTFSYARIDGGWKVVASHSTPIVVDEEE